MGLLVRCDGCGEMRWSLRAMSTDDAIPEVCDICGGPLRIERRRPGRRFIGKGRERRDFRAPARLGPSA